MQLLLPMLKTKTFWFFSTFLLLLFVYSVFSYTFTDTNLVLSTWQPYWQFQQWLWHTLLTNVVWLTNIYTILIVGLFGVYYGLVKELQQTMPHQPVQRRHVYLYGLVIVALFFSYNALSHDVFNYIFNAKMVVVYRDNPHISTALKYSDDLWTRFMHNTHTPAPYGYGWTALSVVPFFVGFNKFIITWLAFRLYEVISIVLLFYALQFLSGSVLKRKLTIPELAVLFLNPLFLIEIISSMHNDLWMVAPAILAVGHDLKILLGGRWWERLCYYWFPYRLSTLLHY
jgi:hypothetical protein